MSWRIYALRLRLTFDGGLAKLFDQILGRFLVPLILKIAMVSGSAAAVAMCFGAIASAKQIWGFQLMNWARMTAIAHINSIQVKMVGIMILIVANY